MMAKHTCSDRDTQTNTETPPQRAQRQRRLRRTVNSIVCAPLYILCTSACRAIINTHRPECDVRLWVECWLVCIRVCTSLSTHTCHAGLRLQTQKPATCASHTPSFVAPITYITHTHYARPQKNMAVSGSGPCNARMLIFLWADEQYFVDVCMHYAVYVCGTFCQIIGLSVLANVKFRMICEWIQFRSGF